MGRGPLNPDPTARRRPSGTLDRRGQRPRHVDAPRAGGHHRVPPRSLNAGLRPQPTRDRRARSRHRSCRRILRDLSRQPPVDPRAPHRRDLAPPRPPRPARRRSVRPIAMWSERVGDGPALVFLHGDLGDSRLREPQWHALDGFTRVPVDFPGYGHTPSACSPHAFGPAHRRRMHISPVSSNPRRAPNTSARSCTLTRRLHSPTCGRMANVPCMPTDERAPR